MSGNCTNPDLDVAAQNKLFVVGTTYDYWNQDERQYFSSGLLIQNDKKSGVGRGAGARALALLLRCDWAGDRIALMGDEESLEWRDGATDISIDVIALLLDVDGTDWLELDGLGFDVACSLAMHLNHPGLLVALDEKFGPAGWRKRFVESSRSHTSDFADRIFEAQRRGIIRFRAHDLFT